MFEVDDSARELMKADGQTRMRVCCCFLKYLVLSPGQPSMYVRVVHSES